MFKVFSFRENQPRMKRLRKSSENDIKSLIFDAFGPNSPSNSPPTKNLKRDELNEDDFDDLFDDLFDASVPQQPPQPQQPPELYPFQVKGVQFLLDRDKGRGGLLADQQGLGKTVQVSAFLSKSFTQSGNQSTLILVPSSVIHQWQQELFRFGIVPLLYYGSTRNFSRLVQQHRQAQQSQQAHQQAQHPLVVLTTHSTMAQSLSQAHPQSQPQSVKRTDGVHNLFNWMWKRVIVDEGHEFRELKTKRSKALDKIQRDSTILLTGTPVLNNLPEFCNLMYHISRNSAFKNTKASPETVRLVNDLKGKFLLRRTKKDVSYNGVGSLILPSLIHITREVRFQKSEKEVYIKLWNKFIMGMRDFLRGGEKTAVHILAAITKLRLFCAHPYLSIDENGVCQKHLLKKYLEGETEDILPVSGKLSHILKDLKVLCEDSGNKILIFSQWTSVLDIIAHFLGRFDTLYGKFVRLDGKTTQKERKRVVDMFQTDPSIRIFLISTKAGGIGLNLTAANHVFVCDPCWNPGIEEQSIDRAHRCGQKRDVTVHRFILKDPDSIEECMLQLQSGKQEHVDVICGTNQKKWSVPTLRLFLKHVNAMEGRKKREIEKRQ